MMFHESKHKILLIFISFVGLILGAATYYFIRPAPESISNEIHVHSDMMVYIGDERFRFTDDKYQSSPEQILNPDFHLHDNIDEVIHRHAANLTLTNFFQSLGFTLNNECLVTDTGIPYCNTDNGKVQLYVNGELVNNIVSYIPEEEDRILVYYGSPTGPNLLNYLNGISDQSCIYSGNCPERGIAPRETCGLTCEL